MKQLSSSELNNMNKDEMTAMILQMQKQHLCLQQLQAQMEQTPLQLSSKSVS